MRTTRPVEGSHPVVFELSRLPGEGVRLTTSIPSRDGTVRRDWPAEAPWEDIQAALLAALSDWLWMTGGRQERLPGTV